MFHRLLIRRAAATGHTLEYLYRVPVDVALLDYGMVARQVRRDRAEAALFHALFLAPKGPRSVRELLNEPVPPLTPEAQAALEARKRSVMADLWAHERAKSLLTG